MEDAADASLDPVSGEDLPSDDPEVPLQNSHLSADLKQNEVSCQDLESKCKALEEALVVHRREKDEARKQSLHLVKALEEVSNERDDLILNLGVLQSEKGEARKQNLRLVEELERLSNERDDLILNVGACKEREDDLVRRRDDEIRDKLRLEDELQHARDRIVGLCEEQNRKMGVLSQGFEYIKPVEDCLKRVVERIERGMLENFAFEDGADDDPVLGDEAEMLLEKIRVAHGLSNKAEERMNECEERIKKEKKQLENSIVSLTEENRDITSLLRIALVEKEKVEKQLNRLKGGGEQKRVALLQFAEKGLQKVGFGFMVGASTGDSAEISSSNAGQRSDSSDYEEEVVGLASTVEKIMKNLRLEISQLKQSLDDSRSESERLQSLTEKQTQKIAENALYIKDLEEREVLLTQNVEERMTELTEAEEDAKRWRQACELEVEAGKIAIEQRDKEVASLEQELQNARASINVLTNKMKLKKELASAAEAAQAAAERSLRLVDSRCIGFRDRIEELTRQLEEAEGKGDRRGCRSARYVCWPWRALRLSPAPRRRRVRVARYGPEMEALLHFRV